MPKSAVHSALHAIGLVFTFLLFIGCSNQTSTPKQSKPITDSASQCPDKRPQVCTMIYKPVCGIDAQGQQKTYASDCNACADAKTVAFNDGECPQ